MTGDRVRAYVIWDPIFGGDFNGAAKKLSKSFADKRVSYFKDPDSLAGKVWKRVLKLDNDIAWDVYFLYGANAGWDQEPPQPDFWMHQLYGVTKAPRFNEEVFTKKLKEMLSTAEEKSSAVSSKDRQTKEKRLKIEFLSYKREKAFALSLSTVRLQGRPPGHPFSMAGGTTPSPPGAH